jgi:HEAT repeat protein
VPDGPLGLRDVLAGLGPDAQGPEARATALVALAPSLRKAAVAAVSTSPDRARVVADALLSAGSAGKLGLDPFTAPGEKLDPKLAAAVDDAVETVARAVVPGFVALERHPSVEVRTRAVELLARRSEPEAEAAVIDALGDPDDTVRRAALSAVGPVKSDRLTAAVAALVKDSPSWPLRVRAAEALGRLGHGGRVTETLFAAARTDTFALVREAAARAAAALDPAAARPLLEELAAKDAEPRVREAATDLLARK